MGTPGITTREQRPPGRSRRRIQAGGPPPLPERQHLAPRLSMPTAPHWAWRIFYHVSPEGSPPQSSSLLREARTSRAFTRRSSPSGSESPCQHTAVITEEQANSGRLEKDAVSGPARRPQLPAHFLYAARSEPSPSLPSSSPAQMVPGSILSAKARPVGSGCIKHFYSNERTGPPLSPQFNLWEKSPAHPGLGAAAVNGEREYF